MLETDSGPRIFAWPTPKTQEFMSMFTSSPRGTQRMLSIANRSRSWLAKLQALPEFLSRRGLGQLPA